LTRGSGGKDWPQQAQICLYGNWAKRADPKEKSPHKAGSEGDGKS